MKVKFFLLVAFFVFFITALPARAFEISPIKVLLTVDPASTQTIVVKIKNTEKNDLNFKLSVLGMTQDADGKPIFDKGISLAESWVNPENNLINIKSGEIKSVNFIIKTPADAVSGSYYLGLSVEPVLENSGGGSLSARLVSLLTLEVKGLVRESVIVEKLEQIPSVGEEKNWKFNLNLKNNGTIEVLMQGTLAVRNWRSEEIFSEPIILGNKLLAGSKRVLHPELNLGNKISLPGLYSAQVKINYGRTNQMVSAIVYIWYFPKWSKIALIFSAVFIALLIFWRKKRAK